MVGEAFAVAVHRQRATAPPTAKSVCFIWIVLLGLEAELTLATLSLMNWDFARLKAELVPYRHFGPCADIRSSRMNRE
jgi:hypothetical protein